MSSRATFRLMAAGDLHWHERSRFDECLRVHQAIIDMVARERPDVFMIPGDIYEQTSTITERLCVSAWIIALAQMCPVVIARGNHDRPQDVELMSRLRGTYPITVEERAGVHLVGPAAIAAVAWPDTASIAAMLGRPLSTQALDDVAREALRNVLRGLGAQLAQHDGPRILMGHFMIDGSTTSVGQPLIGQELNVGLADLALANAGIVIAGHVHKPQDWMHGEMPVIYTGSPYRTSYGEIEQKSVVLADFDGARLTSWRRIPTPARPMVLVQGAWIPPQGGEAGRLELDEAGQELLAGAEEGAARNSEVRIVYHVDADQQATARGQVSQVKEVLLQHGAADVKVEARRNVVVRARAPEVARAESLGDKMLAFWASRGTTPETDRGARLIAKLGQVDLEVERFVGVSGAIRVKRWKFAGFRPYQHEVEVDVDQLPGQIVAVCGANGAGKSTLLELVPGALYREMPTHGGLADMATARNAYVEVTVSAGKTWTIRQTIDVTSRDANGLVLDGNDKPVVKGKGVKPYDAWAKQHLQPQSLFQATSFGVQRSGGFLEMTDGNRKAVVLRALGIERYEALSARAADHAKALRVERDKLEGELKAHRERYGDLGAAEAAHRAAADQVREAEVATAAARAALSQAQKEAAAAREAGLRYTEACAAREELSGRLDAARAEHESLLVAERAGATMLAQADAIRGAQRQLAEATTREVELRADLARHEDAARAAERDATEAARRAAAAEERRAAADRRASEARQRIEAALVADRRAIVEIERRIAADRDGVLARADEIRAAAARLSAVVTEHASARAEERRLREAREAAQQAASRASSAAAKELAAVSAARSLGGRLGRATRRVETLRADVARARQELDIARISVGEAETRVEHWDGEVTRLEGTRLCGADERILALRGALSEIAMPTAGSTRAPEDVASAALRADTATAEAAATVPGFLTTGRAELKIAKDQLAWARRELASLEAMAAREPELREADAELREAESDVARAEAAVGEHERAAAEARAEAERLQGELSRRRRGVGLLDGEYERLNPLARRVAELASAEGRAAELEWRLQHLRSDELNREEALAAAPRDGGEESAASEREAQAERDAAEAADARLAAADRAAGASRRALDALAIGLGRLQELAARAEDLAREEALAAGRAVQIARAAAEVERLSASLDAVAAVEPPAPAPDVDAFADGLRSAKEAELAAHKASAVAERAVEQARTGADQVKILVARDFEVEEAISDWDRLARDLGRNGLQAAEIDCVGPEISDLANDLLHQSYSTRWTVILRGSKTSKDGRDELDGFEIRVIDSNDGREADAKLFSPGQKAILGEALANALCIVACRRAGVDGPTLFRDETCGPLDSVAARAYVAMLRRVAEAIGANKVFVVAHSAEVQEMADSRIEIDDGRIMGASAPPSAERGQLSLMGEVA